ncbi:flagellar basal body P-ring formation chaperone FlgA [Piscinibacter sp.]|uniref:flagellar basal body P-ring formation chaperone FlgA n=1 Tax=Piscinibacter sp. TaxID=1903157 RepID=UPI0039E61659
MHSWACILLCASALLGAAPVRADGDMSGVHEQVKQFAGASVQAAQDTRVQVEVGSLDPRLKLAPCAQIQPYLPPSARLWGRSRIGLRCASGPTRWNVYLPITVKVFAPAVVATRALPAGSVLQEADLARAEVDLAEESSAALRSAGAALGRALDRPLAAGASLRQSHLRPRQWFAAGETVQLLAQGPGFQVGGSGQALSAGIEGQPVRIRAESGRILTAEAVGERRARVHP